MLKVAHSDTVHPVQDLSDMRRRVGAHRRCFLFMHEAMPREPLVVVHVALMNKIADSIQVSNQSFILVKEYSVNTVNREI